MRLALLFLAFGLGCAEDEPSDDGPRVNSNDEDGDGYFKDEDCDDHDPDTHPGAVEVCDNEDNDCDGLYDEDLGDVFYEDADSDGYGNPYVKKSACDQPTGYVPYGTDCDDDDPDNFPGNDELCDGRDNDCNDLVDDDCQ